MNETMHRYQFLIAGEDCGTIWAPNIDRAVLQFTKDMEGYDQFTSAGLWFEEEHRCAIRDFGRVAEQVEIVNLDTGMTLALEHSDVRDDAEDSDDVEE